VRYKLGFYVSEDGILHSHRHENPKSYKALKSGICSGDLMCFLWGMKLYFISQKTAFFIATATKIQNLASLEFIAVKNKAILVYLLLLKVL
jgi:hypothetical protein